MHQNNHFLLSFFRGTHLAVCFLIVSLSGFSQIQRNIQGRVFDATTHRPLTGVSVTIGETFASQSVVDGSYLIKGKAGRQNVRFSLPGFQTKIVTEVDLPKYSDILLDVLLYPIRVSSSQKSHSTDSLNVNDSLLTVTYKKESVNSAYNKAGYPAFLTGDLISGENIKAGTDKNGLLLLKRLNGLIVEDDPVNNLHQSFLISGMGERYNQLTLNGPAFSSFDGTGSSYPLELLPAEAIEEVSVRKLSDGSLPSDFAGGSVNVNTRDHTENNFFYIQAGAGFYQGTTGQHFLGDNQNTYENIGFSGSQRNLPSDFPTTRSQVSFDGKNIQEQVYLSQQLKNNLAPQNNSSNIPNERILLGFGRNFKLKSGARISLVSYLNQTKTQQTSEANVQMSPDIAGNPYPFVQNTALIRAQSTDTSYEHLSQLGFILNASVVYGKSKISIRNYLGSQLSNTYVSGYGVDKPDEDSLAHRSIHYQTTQRGFYTTQISGEHALANSGRLKLNWQASYTYYNQNNPDERNFLLRQDSTINSNYEIATPQTAGQLTNTGRTWRNMTDHNFTGSFNISSPFNLFQHPQVLSGGIYIQENYREMTSDLLLTQGTGYTSLAGLLDPGRYYPGGVSVSNFYVNTIVNVNNIQQTNRANYTASSNLGAAYIRFESHLSDKLEVDLGMRMESNSQLASNTQYRYFEGYKNPQLFPINENTRITSFNPLPSLLISYSPIQKIRVWGSYFGSVNRPRLQELVQTAFYNQPSFMVTMGNPLLATSAIDNWNAGINWLANAFTNISVNGFYKKIDQPIENIISTYSNGIAMSMPYNTPPAVVKGLEANINLRLSFIRSPWLSHMSIFANGNITRSRADGGPIRSLSVPNVSEHTLSGTPDYSLNTGLVIQQPAFPELSLIYRATGDYIVALGSGTLYTLSNGKTIWTIPDYRMKNRQQLDIQLSQKFFKQKLQLIAGVNNLAAGSYIQYQDLNGNKKFDEPLHLTRMGNNGGLYSGGTDNTLINMKQQPGYYFSISYLFN